MIVAKTHNARAIHSHGTDFTFLPGGVGGGFAVDPEFGTSARKSA